MVCIDCSIDLPNAHPLTKRCTPCKQADARKRAAAYQKANPEHVNQKNREWRAANYDHVRQREKKYVQDTLEKRREAGRKNMRRRAGVVNPTGEKRHGRCENPGCPYDGPLVLDHNHSTGEARGWLCDPCNTSFGALQESEARILGLDVYRKKYLTHQPDGARL